MSRAHQLDTAIRALKLSGMLDTLDARIARGPRWGAVPTGPPSKPYCKGVITPRGPISTERPPSISGSLRSLLPGPHRSD